MAELIDTDEGLTMRLVEMYCLELDCELGNLTTISSVSTSLSFVPIEISRKSSPLMMHSGVRTFSMEFALPLSMRFPNSVYRQFPFLSVKERIVDVHLRPVLLLVM